MHFDLSFYWKAYLPYFTFEFWELIKELEY